MDSTQGFHLNGTTEGNFNFPLPKGVVVTGWGEDSLPHAVIASPTLNNLNPSHNPEIAKDMEKGVSAVAKKHAQNAMVGQNMNLTTADRGVSEELVSEQGERSNHPITISYPFIHNLSKDIMPADLDWSIDDKHAFIEMMIPEIHEQEKREPPPQSGLHRLGCLILVAAHMRNNTELGRKPFDINEKYAILKALLMALLNMVGRDGRLLRSTGLRWNLPPWPGFCALVFDRFAQRSDYEVLENSHSPKQYNHSVLDYTDKFEELIKIWPIENEDYYTRVEGREIIEHGLSDENQKVRTITTLSLAAFAEAAAPYGFDIVLKPLWKSIRSHLGKVLLPFLKAIDFIIPLMDAYHAVTEQSKSYFQQAKSKPPLDTTVQKKDTTLKPFIPGVCKYCGDKWFLGHKCKQYQQVNLMVGEGEVVISETSEQEKGEPPPQSDLEAQLMQISIQAVRGVRGISTYTLEVNIGGKDGMTLVDSGSTHTFMDLTFATQITCNIQIIPLQRVAVAGGGTLWIGSYIPDADYYIRGEKFSDSFKVLPLKGYDIVLGCDWMFQHSPVSLDLKIRRLIIKKYGVIETVFEEHQPTPLVRVINPKSWYKVDGPLCEMLDWWISSDVVTYNAIIAGLCKAQTWDRAEMFLNRMIKDSVRPDCTTYTILVHGYCFSRQLAENGRSTEARKNFDSMVERGPSSVVQKFHGQHMLFSKISPYSAMKNPAFYNAHSAYWLPLWSYRGMDATTGLSYVLAKYPVFASALKEKGFSGCMIGLLMGGVSAAVFKIAVAPIERDKLYCGLFLGADGARSTVRKMAGISMKGKRDLHQLIRVHFLSKDLGKYLSSERPGMLFFIFNPEAIGELVAPDLEHGEFVLHIPFYPSQQMLEDFSAKDHFPASFLLAGANILRNDAGAGVLAGYAKQQEEASWEDAEFIKGIFPEIICSDYQSWFPDSNT